MWTFRSFLVWLVSLGPISTISHLSFATGLVDEDSPGSISIFVNALIGFHIGFGFQSCNTGTRAAYPVLVLWLDQPFLDGPAAGAAGAGRYDELAAGAAYGAYLPPDLVSCIACPLEKRRTIHCGWNSAKSWCRTVTICRCTRSIHKVSFLFAQYSDGSIIG